MNSFERFMADMRVRAATPLTPQEQAMADYCQRFASAWSMVSAAAHKPPEPPEPRQPPSPENV